MTAQYSDFDVDNSTRLRSLSRSPRPYRRTQSPHTEPKPVGIRRWSIREMAAEAEGVQVVGGLSDRQTTPRVTPSPPSRTPMFTPSPTASSSRSPKAVVWAMRNQGSSLGSESGTEADDELPKKLPAPPRRNRSKGLLGAGEEVEEEDGGDVTGGTTGDCGGMEEDMTERNRKGKGRSRDKEVLVGGEGVDDAGGGAKRRRKKIAFVRRGVEIALMGGVVGVCLAGRRRDGGEGRNWEAVCGEFGMETLSWCFAFCGVLVAYPLIIISRRIISTRLRKATITTLSPPSPPLSLSSLIQLPRSIDPAPLLYPIFFPLAVSISISPSVLLQNLILTLASLPPRLFPTDFPFQWIISLFPLFIPTLLSSYVDLKTSAISLEREVSETLSYLPLLQKTLIDVLAYTLQPSLTMTEIRLLSTGLVNLLISSASPQGVVLKSLLWIGGFGIMLGCSDLITWLVQLSRIPRHRFRRAGEVVRSIGRFSGNLARRSNRGEYASSADEGEHVEEQGFFSSMMKGNSTTTGPGTVAFKCVDGNKNKFPVSIVLSPAPTSPPEVLPLANPNQTTSSNTAPAKRKRGYSTPSPLAWATSLTHAQAQRRKYIYAALVYAIILVLIFFAIRPYLGNTAFHGLDPFPWAASYLFCGLPGYGNLTSLISNWLGYPLTPGEGWTGCTPWYNSEWTDPSSSSPPSRFSSYQSPEDIANRRLYIFLYWGIILSLGIALVFSPISSSFEVDTRRKIFHGMVVGMFLLVGVVDPPFTHLAMSLVLAVFGLADLLRAGQLPPVSRPLSGFLAPFVDGRDLKGPVVVSHFFLLVGGAAGGWFSIAAASASATPTSNTDSPAVATKARELAFLAGVVCVGLGDSAASLVGRRIGRTKWGWAGGKSLEGSMAFMGAVGVGLTVARWWLGKLGGVGVMWGGMVWAKIWAAAAGAAMLEAVVTGGNDNVVVPVGMWVVVRGLGL